MFMYKTINIFSKGIGKMIKHRVREHTTIQMELLTRETGMMINKYVIFFINLKHG